MQYSLEKISTVAQCDALLASAQKKKQTMERRTRNLGESIDRFRNRLDQIAQEMVLVQAMLLIFMKGYNALPERSKYKLSMNVKIKRLELRQARLALKAFACNERALLVKQVKYNRLRAQLAAMNGYIVAVQNRKAELIQVDVRGIQPASLSLLPSAWMKNRSPFGNSLTGEQKDEIRLAYAEWEDDGHLVSRGSVFRKTKK